MFWGIKYNMQLYIWQRREVMSFTRRTTNDGSDTRKSIYEMIPNPDQTPDVHWLTAAIQPFVSATVQTGIDWWSHLTTRRHTAECITHLCCTIHYWPVATWRLVVHSNTFCCARHKFRLPGNTEISVRELRYLFTQGSHALSHLCSLVHIFTNAPQGVIHQI